MRASFPPRLRPAATLALTLALAGCGGGLYIGIGGDTDEPPSVSLVVDRGSAAAGTVLTFTAAASDDFRVSAVTLYRRDATGDVLIGTDDVAPYLWDTALPASSTGQVGYYARAEDDIGQRADSAVVTVQVLP